ncbi:MAG TPA: hypothetical protein VJ583_05845 [Nitrososphaeraceae archaeon]|nr:hypothetical protein [Nitrososphaeraceae archaeon]
MKICYIIGHDKKGESVPGIDWEYNCSKCGVGWDKHGYYGGKFRYTFWTSGIWESAKFFFRIIGLASLLLIFFSVFNILLSNASCNSYEKFGVETVYDIWAGCMAKHPKLGFIPVEEFFRTINIINP